jgi:DNA-binding response OmpR family regulator
LVVDPSEQFRTSIFELVKWVDRRHRIELAEDGVNAWTKAMNCRPRLVFCEPELPDVKGAVLCSGLRRHLRKSLFIAYTRSPQVLALESSVGFDGVLEKPATGVAVLNFIREAKKRRAAATALVREGAPEPDEGPLDSAPNNFFRPISIYVRLAEESIKFAVPVPASSSMSAVLRQIGKKSVVSFNLIRDGADLKADLNTRVVEGDVVSITT